MFELPDVSLVALSSINIYETIQAIKYSMRKIKFGDCVFISHKKPFYLPQSIRFEQTSELKTIDDYNYKMLYEVYKYIKTDFILVVHYDGFIANPLMWRKDFLNFDYIGSPWSMENSLKDIYGNIIRVGNGVSLRSRKILELPAKLNIPFKYGEGKINNEDIFICVRYRHLFLQNSIKYAPFETAIYFGHETMIPEIEGIKPFVFHKWRGSNKYYKKYGRHHFRLFMVLERVKNNGIKKSIKYYFNKYIKRDKRNRKIVI
jgi:hypothetical protein